jgi:hypothetical protein
MIDPSIPLQVKTPNLAQVYMQAQALKNGQQQQQMNQISLAQAMRQQQDQTDTDEAFRAGGGDQQKAIAYLQQSNPRLAAGMQTQLAQQQVEQQKQAAAQRKADLENAKAHVDLVGRVAQSLTPQNWQQVRQQAIAQGITSEQEFPQQYDPAFVQQAQQQALTAKEKIDAEMKKLEDTETARHNTATEATAAATQAETAEVSQRRSWSAKAGSWHTGRAPEHGAEQEQLRPGRLD